MNSSGTRPVPPQVKTNLSTRRTVTRAKARPTNVRRPRRTTRTTPSTVKLPRMPPPLSINANIGTHWIRNYVTVNIAINFNDNVGSDIFFQDTGFAAVYGEFRIKRINIWYIPQTAVVTSPGDYAFAAVDDDEVAAKARDFKTISLMPGSSIRRLYQPAQGCWFPTEPTDKDWRCFDNSWTIFCVRIATTGTYKLDGYCVYDAHVSFRATSAALKESVPNLMPPNFASKQPQPTNQMTEQNQCLSDRIARLESLLSRAVISLPDN